MAGGLCSSEEAVLIVRMCTAHRLPVHDPMLERVIVLLREQAAPVVLAAAAEETSAAAAVLVAAVVVVAEEASAAEDKYKANESGRVPDSFAFG